MSESVVDKIRAMQERLAFRSAHSRRKPAPPAEPVAAAEAAGATEAVEKPPPPAPPKSRWK